MHNILEPTAGILEHLISPDLWCGVRLGKPSRVPSVLPRTLVPTSRALFILEKSDLQSHGGRRTAGRRELAPATKKKRTVTLSDLYCLASYRMTFADGRIASNAPDLSRPPVWRTAGLDPALVGRSCTGGLTPHTPCGLIPHWWV